MMERRTLTIRNHGKPGREVLPCKLTLTELEPRWARVGAIEQQVLAVEAELAAAKSKAKAALDKLAEERATMWKQIADGSEDRTTQVEYLVDVEEGYMYARRLDMDGPSSLVRRRELTKHELQAARQGDLFERDAPTRTLEVPDDIPTVRRFDSDTPDVGTDEPEAASASAGDNGGHECTFNEGSCVTCGAPEPADAPPRRGKRGGKGKGYDTRGAAAH